jgi:uncharacterized protein
MIRIGKENTLTVLRETSAGLHLGDGDNNEVLLPNSFIKKPYKIREQLSVFIYKDAEDRLIATTKKPYASLFSFACLKVKEVNASGAFLDWGIEKDLFVPFKEQKSEMTEGSSHVVYVYIDEISNRIIGSSKISQFISNEVLQVKAGEEVNLLVFEESPLGYSCIINAMHRGLLYRNEIFKDIEIGDNLKGYIKTIRPDNLIDLSLQQPGFKNVLSATDMILEYLHENDGFLGLSDKSSPAEIAELFNMSKATFKKSIGILYRQRKVVLKDEGVHLLKEDDSKKDLTAE